MSKAPETLWRLESRRVVYGETITHVNWFHTKQAAEKHAKWLKSRDAEILNLNMYGLLDPSDLGLGRYRKHYGRHNVS